MRSDGSDPIDSEPEDAASEAASSAPVDAAESIWDPWLWALYLREVAETTPRTLH
jgi:hypothetical protein